jgi:nucleotide-binding universal stress UspA family protein
MKRVLVGYDGSDAARDALALGGLLGRAIGGELVVACVYAHEPILSEEVQLARHQDAEAKVDSALASIGRIGLPLHGLAHPSTSAARGLCELAEDAEFVVIGAHRHPSPSKLLPVRVASRLLHGSACPVVIAPHDFATRAPERLTRVTVGFDGSPESRLAAGEAARLASAGEVELFVLRALPEPRPELIRALSSAELTKYVKREAEDAQAEVDQIVSELAETVPCRGEVVTGDPGRCLRTAAAGADLLVVGSRGYGPVKGVLLGSVSGALVRSGGIPLLVTPRSVTAAVPQPIPT